MYLFVLNALIYHIALVESNGSTIVATVGNKINFSNLKLKCTY